MSRGKPPVVSIITATYNWRSVLRCAIESARMQTFTGFEHLVVGDGCTDDSEAVVKSFGDRRLRWMNLPENTGGQAMPNNYGIAAARAEYIAYLGHDDIWYPTHLEMLLATIRRTDADVAGSVAILYGPPGSGVRAVSGVFGGGEFSRHDFMPPSFILHKRSLVERIGGWLPAREIGLPTDVEFEQRARTSGARIVSTGVLTAFKFNAAWRRNAYLERSSSEQEQMPARIRTGVDFRQAELIEVLRAVESDTYIRIDVPEEEAPGRNAGRNARYKGTAKERPPLRKIDERTGFTLDDQQAGFEWHSVEMTDRWGSARWSGPARLSTLEFPVGSIDRPSCESTCSRNFRTASQKTCGCPRTANASNGGPRRPRRARRFCTQSSGRGPPVATGPCRSPSRWRVRSGRSTSGSTPTDGGWGSW